MSHKVTSKCDVRLTYEEAKGLEPVDKNQERVISTEMKKEIQEEATKILDKACKRLGVKGCWGKDHQLGFGNKANGYCVSIPVKSKYRSEVNLVIDPLAGIMVMDDTYKGMIQSKIPEILQSWSIEKAINTSRLTNQYFEEKVDQKTGDVITLHHVDDPSSGFEDKSEWE